MKNINYIFSILFVSILILTSCGKSLEELLQEDREKKQELLQEKEVVVYKGLKILLRSAVITADSDTLDLNNLKYTEKTSGIATAEKTQKFATLIFKKLLEQTDNSTTLTLKDYIQLYQEYKTVKELLVTINEDDFPTIFEVLTHAFNLQLSENINPSTLDWDTQKEHLALAVVMEASQKLPAPLKVYELSMIDVTKLDKNEILPIAQILKGIAYVKQEWIYLAEYELSQSIDLLEQNSITVKYGYDSSLMSNKLNADEELLIQLHAINLLTRGYSRIKMDFNDKNKAGIKDFEEFLVDVKKIDIDNELVWFVDAYVNINNENNEAALIALTKLENSSLILEHEKEAITNIKSYIEDRNPNKALNAIYDKAFIFRLTISYLSKYVNDAEWHQKIAETKAGKKLLSIPKIVETEFEQIKDATNINNLTNKGTDLLKSLTE